MPLFNSDIIFLQPSGQIVGQTGELTLRANDDDTGDIIVGSGKTFRPERDLHVNLGNFIDHRWLAGNFGEVHCLSGFFGYRNTLIGYRPTFGVAEGLYSALFGSGQFIQTENAYMDSSVRITGDSDFAGLFVESQAKFSGLNTHWNNIIPGDDAAYDIGSPGNNDAVGPFGRWANVYAASGHLNSLYPAVSGTGVGGHPGEYIEVGGSLIPPVSIGNAGNFWLGATKFNLWAGVAATSGIFTDLTSTTSAISDLTIGSELNFSNNADIINAGALDWDLGGSQTLVGNGDWVFDTDATLSATTGTFTTATIPTLNATTGTITTATIPTLGSTTITANTINCLTAFNAFGSFGTLGLAIFNGGAFFGNASAPSNDASFPIGLQGFRFSYLYAVSGIMEAITPGASGASLLMHGHIVPGNDAVFDLGNTERNWGAVHAVSGVFDNGVRSDLGLAEYQLATGSGTFTGSTWVDLEWDTNVVEDTEFYSRSAGVVTINQDGLYRVTYGINTGSVGTGRATAGSRVLLNGSTLVGGSTSFIYSRTTGDDEGTSTKSFLVNLNATDTLVVQSHQEDGSAHNFSFLDECNMNLEFIR